MDETTLKIAMAAFMHDVGKFPGKKEMPIPEEYFNGNAGIYLPKYNNQYTHRHALYTARFIEFYGEWLPPCLNAPDWGEGDCFINLSAGHHNPETPMQWVIAMADRVSSGWDRDNFESEYNRSIAWQDYRKTRLLTLFEQLDTEGKKKFESMDDFSWCYPLRSLGPDTIFPEPGKPKKDIPRAQADAEYGDLFKEFILGLKRLRHRNACIPLWFEHFESLMMRFTSCIPQARAGKVIPDVSLYDHSRISAALAAAIYLYHRDTDFTVKAIRNYDDKKFLIVGSDFYGIQNFIFSGFGESGKYRSKILRGRSFYVSLLGELAADMICREIGIPFTSVLLNAAGKFTIFSPNTEAARKAVRKVEERINRWLFDVSFGETAMGFTTMEASFSDFVPDKFPDLWEEKGGKNDERKFSRIDIEAFGGSVKGFLNRFNNDLANPLCPICARRPSSPEAENSHYVEETGSSCGACRDHVFLGANLVKKNRMIVVRNSDEVTGREKRLFFPLFEAYQVMFADDIGKKETEHLITSGKVVKYWDLRTDRKALSETDVTLRFINGYVPVYSPEDRQDPRLSGEEIPELGTPKTLEHIALKARNPTDRENVFRGVPALGVLKADVDDLGLLMSCGLPKERFTLSRLATLSRQLNNFFSLFLPDFLENEPEFREIYTVFAGGDDLFLIGPWNRLFDLVLELRTRFRDYVCRNEEIRFSAGLSMHKDHTPVDFMAQNAEKALERSKKSDKNRLTFFSETVPWDEMDALMDVRKSLEAWMESESINSAMLYRLNGLLPSVAGAKRLEKKKTISMAEMDCFKWRALLAYSTSRNVAKNLKGDQRDEAVRNVTEKLTAWLERFGGNIRIPLWRILYDNR